MQFPCGKCYDCKGRRVSGWSFRLMKEAERSSSALFVTLTYDTSFVPITERGFMSLKKKDFQDFIKRLRSKMYERKNKEKIKYYACGEYGGKTKRPHYHAILFNAMESLIDSSWSLGSIHIGKLSAASASYTLKYISKPSRIPEHKNDDRVKEFSLMSKGLGSNYVTPEMVEWHKNDLVNRFYTPLHGKKLAMSRYLKEKIYTQEERELIGTQLIAKEVDNFHKLSAKEKLVKMEKDELIRLEKERKNGKDDRLNTVL